MEEKKQFNLKAMFLAIIVCIPLLALTITLNYLVSTYLPNLPYLRAILFAVWVLSLVVNLCCYVVIAKKMKKVMSEPAKTLDLLLETKKDAQLDYHKIQQSNVRKMQLNVIYALFNYLLPLCLAVFGFGRSSPEQGLFFPFHLLVVYVNYSFFYSIFSSKFVDEKPSPIKKDDLKELYEIVDEVVAENNIDIKYELHIDNNSTIGVYEEGGKLHIVIGFYTLCILNRDEFKGAILHEFGHFKNKDTDNSARYTRYQNLCSYIGPNAVMRMFFEPFAELTVFNTWLLRMLATRYYEILADEVVKSGGLDQQMINGLAKMRVFDYFDQSALVDGSFFAKEEKLAEEYYINLYRCFLTYFYQNEQFLTDNVGKEITGRFETHLALGDRMEQLGLSGYTMTFTCVEDSPFYAVIERVNKIIYDVIIESTKDEYDKAHKYYLELFENLAKYPTIAQIPVAEKMILMTHAYEVNEVNVAYDIAVAMLEEDATLTRPKFYKALIELKNHNDSKAIDTLWDIVNEKDSSEFKTDAFSAIADYCSFIGDIQTVEKIRSMQVEVLEEDKTFEELGEVNSTAEIIKPEIDEEINGLFEVAKKFDCIYVLAVGMKVLRGQKGYHVFVILKKSELDKLEDEVRKDLIEDVRLAFWSYLDTVSERQYFLHLKIDHPNLLHQLSPFMIKQN